MVGVHIYMYNARQLLVGFRAASGFGSGSCVILGFQGLGPLALGLGHGSGFLGLRVPYDTASGFRASGFGFWRQKGGPK